jgi:MFS family permease
MTIWELEMTMARRVLLLCAIAVWIGLILVVLRHPMWSAFGVEVILWGSLYAAIAMFVRRRAQNWSRKADTDHWRKRETNLLSTFLWTAILFSIAGVIFGLALALLLGGKNSGIQGHGWGIVAQAVLILCISHLAWVTSWTVRNSRAKGCEHKIYTAA